MIQVCGNCGEVNWFPRRMCRRCSSDALAWHESPGTGSVYSVTVVHRPPSSGFEAPYALALVDVDGGPRMMTHVVGCAPEEVTVGMPVVVDFDRLSDEISVPVFRPR
jgi:hypothetical protein